MRRLISSALLAAAIAVGGACAVQAQVVERSGNTYHVAVCPGPAAPGTARCHAHVVTDRAGNPIANAVRHVSTNATPSGYGPADLQSAYLINTSGGAGVTVAIVDAYGYANAESDLNVYRSQFGLGACTTANGCFRKVNQGGVQGSYPKNNTGWAQEQALDLDMVSAICPKCNILLVEASSASFANLAAAENTAASLGAHAISNSYGGGEKSSGPYDGAYNHPGIAITVSTGDSGYGAEFPATSEFVTAVGGTSLTPTTANQRGWSESAWSGGGSGCSSVYAKPTWQHDPLCTNRMEADTSAVADPNTGVAVYGPAFGKSAWLVFGGTSVASPLTAAIYGLNGAPATHGSDPYSQTKSLNDVSSGSNGACGGTYLCTAGTGYDGPTGLGTPIGSTAF